MILHFVIDEKVTDQIIENFSKAGENNRFLVFVNNKDESYKYISSTNNNLIKFEEVRDDINSILKTLTPKAILTHAFHLEYAKAINKIENNINIAWYTWGFDVYGLPRIKPDTYASQTNQFLLNNVNNLYFGRFILKYKFTRKIYFAINKNEEDRYSIIFKALKKVRFFVTYLKEDYYCFSKHYSNNYKFINSPFSSIDQYLAGNKDIVLKDDAKNILIGNSNSIESNHLDVFEILKHQDIPDDVSIYTPLSYGDNDFYKTEVINKGTKTLRKRFVPLLDFMNRNDYISMLTSCSTGIFYHYRQQAMGNIIAMLYLGSRVYLSSHNPAYKFFTNNGIVVFDLDKDFRVLKNTKLEDETVKNNKQKLDLIFNESKVLDDIKSLIKSIS
jgi:hypothetical protein